MRKESKPTTPGLYRFVGYRTVSAVRNDIKTLDEVVLVEKELGIKRIFEWYALSFGRNKKFPVNTYQGTWYYIGDEIERITSDASAASPAEG